MIQVNKLKNIVIIGFEKNISKFTLQNCQDIKEEINKEINAPGIKMVFNLKGIKYVDSSGIAVLISVLKTINNQDGDLILSNISNEVMDLIKLMQLQHIFQITATIDEAITLLS